MRAYSSLHKKNLQILGFIMRIDDWSKTKYGRVISYIINYNTYKYYKGTLESQEPFDLRS
jgi:hypothetical protein